MMARSASPGRGVGSDESDAPTDVNAVVGGYLRDLAFAQSSQQKMFGYTSAQRLIAFSEAFETSRNTATASLAECDARTGFAIPPS
jgi:hypothetical protein